MVSRQLHREEFDMARCTVGAIDTVNGATRRGARQAVPRTTACWPIRCAVVTSSTGEAGWRKTLTDLLDRLDVAVEKASDEEFYTDEINN